MTVKPWGFRISVTESPAEEKQRESGLLVPESISAEQIERGIVVDIGVDWDKTEPAGNVFLQPGMVVYYAHGCGHKIGDLRIIDLKCIVAYEE